MRMPYFTTTNATTAIAAVPGGSATAGAGSIMINTIPTSTHAGLQNTMLLQPAGTQQIYVDRLTMLQQTGQVGQVLQPISQGIALAPQQPPQFPNNSATPAASAFLTPPLPQQQFQATGIAPQQQQQSGPPVGGRQPGDPRLNPNQQMAGAGGIQNDWRGNQPPPQPPQGEWAGQRSGGNQQSFYK